MEEQVPQMSPVHRCHISGPLAATASARAPRPLRVLLSAKSLEELLLLVRLDGAVRGRVGHAREREALAHLVLVEERAVRLVDRARRDGARARRARARAARVRQVDAVLLRLVKHVDVATALDRRGAVGRLERDGEHLRRGRAHGGDARRRHLGDGRVEGLGSEREVQHGSILTQIM